MFSAFTPLAGGTQDTYDYPAEYPYDLDAGLDFTRPATGVSIFPFPATIGHVEGCSPLYDEMNRSISGQEINGQIMNILNAQNKAEIFPDIQGGLRKVLG